MKKMTTLILSSLGLVAYAVWFRRELRRAPLIEDPAPDVRREHPCAPDALPGGVRLEAREDYTTDAETKRRLWEKFRREEIRQRPEEGRN